MAVVVENPPGADALVRFRLDARGGAVLSRVAGTQHDDVLTARPADVAAEVLLILLARRMGAHLLGFFFSGLAKLLARQVRIEATANVLREGDEVRQSEVEGVIKRA